MVSIIIPAYNEENHIGSLLSKIPKQYEIIVIDDGSRDNTSKVVRRFGIEPVILKKNQGKGYACLEGLKHSNSKLCIFLDGDAQLNPKNIPDIINALQDCDLVIGQRGFKKLPWQRRLSNWYARKMINFITKKNFKDVLCGFRGINKNGFKTLEFKKGGYFFESEMILEAVKNNLCIKGIPIDVSYRIGSRMPFLKSLAVGLWLLKEVVKSTFYRHSYKRAK